MSKELIFSFTKKDFRIDWYRGRGAGGQNRNKHANCCRITHIESGLVATGQDHKERPRNKRDAFNKLVVLLVDRYAPKEQRERYAAGEETTRTYNESKNYVKDHMTNKKYSYAETVGKGDIGKIIEERVSVAIMEDSDEG